MKRQLLASPSLGRNEGADTCKTLPKESLLALAGAAILLLGCQQDPVGKAPGGLEPSASSQQSGITMTPASAIPVLALQSGGCGARAATLMAMVPAGAAPTAGRGARTSEPPARRLEKIPIVGYTRR